MEFPRDQERNRGEEIMSSFAMSLALVCLVVAAPGAQAVAPEIKDDGKFFSADAVKKANDQIREIARKYDKDILIETFAGVPADQAESFAKLTKEERTKFLKKWAEERAHTAVVNGIYVLICKEPSHLEYLRTGKAGTALDNQTVSKAVELLLTDFRMKHYDEGLLACVKFVSDKLASSSSK